MANLHELSERDKKAITCIYVVHGREVKREQVGTHPGMNSFGLEIGRERYIFAWDHMDAKGNQVFWGEPV